MLKQIMKRAWELARSGQSTFGGKAREYFPESLKIAWRERTMNITTIEQQYEAATGKKYQRPGPVAICQDHEVLKTINILEYDLKDKEFVSYFEKRTGLLISQMVNDFKKVLSPTEQANQDHSRITQARLQDAWQLYKDVA